MSATVRGQEFLISASRINKWLGIKKPPVYREPKMSNAEIFSTLRPGVQMGPLRFRPSEMSDFFRCIWYVFSRMMIYKFGNWTHFTSREYKMFALIIMKEKQNLGDYIFAELRRYRTTSKKTTRIPFPHIISLILKANKIWYLDASDTLDKPERLEPTHLTNMGIELPLARGGPTFSMKRKKTPPPSLSIPQSVPQSVPQGSAPAPEDDTQSSAPPPQTTGTDPALQAFITQAIEAALAPVHARMAQLVQQANEQSTALRAISASMSLFAEAMDSMRGIHRDSPHHIPTPGPIPSPHSSPRPIIGHFSLIPTDPSQPVHVTIAPIDIPGPSHIPEPHPSSPIPDAQSHGSDPDDHITYDPPYTEPILEPASHPSPVPSSHSSQDEEVPGEVPPVQPVHSSPPGSPRVPPLDLPEPEASGGSSAAYRDDEPHTVHVDVDEDDDVMEIPADSYYSVFAPFQLEPLLLLTYPGYPGHDDDNTGESSSHLIEEQPQVEEPAVPTVLEEPQGDELPQVDPDAPFVPAPPTEPPSDLPSEDPAIPSPETDPMDADPPL